MPKLFSTAYVEKLNAQHSGGVFLRAVEITETTSPLVIRRYVAFSEAITFNGNIYDPLHMEWSGLETSNGMTLPTVGVVVPVAHEVIQDWAETFDVRENDVRLQILHLDLLNDLSAIDELLLQVQAVATDYATHAVTFTLGLNLGLQDQLPRNVILKSEFPGIPDANVKILG